MRPKLLEIEGLQSFKTRQRIDFEQLGETGLFGIFGPTGSGKSTVLDAITLALYGRVKRAEYGTQGIINSNMETAGVAFTFELMQGNVRKTYRAERSYKRKKGSENSCEPKVVRLIEVTSTGEVVLSDKTTEVTGAIEKLLGLSHDDFTRAVVLPQNSFHEFLFLDNAKKREMLERIFYLEEYGRLLTDKLSRKMAGMRSSLDVLSGELAAYSDATDEALALSRIEMEASIEERSRVEKEAKLLEKKYVETREVWQYTQDLALILAREKNHALKREEINEKRKVLDKSGKAKGLMERIRYAEEQESLLGKTRKQLDELLHTLPESERTLEKVQNEYDALKSEISVEQPRLISLKTRLSDALALQEQIAAADVKLLELGGKAEKLVLDISSGSREYDNLKAQLEVLNQAANKYQKELASLQAAPEYREQILHGVSLENEVKAKKAGCIELEGDIARLNTAIKSIEQEQKRTLDKLARHQAEAAELNLKKQQHEASMPEGRNELEKDKDRLNTLRNGLQVLKIRQSALKQADEKVLMLEASCEDLENRANEAREIMEIAGAAFEQSRLEVEELAREYERNAAYMLSISLKQGEPCPVCGSPDHPSPAAHGENIGVAGYEEKLKAAKKKLGDREKTFKESEKNFVIIQEQLHATMLQRDQARQDREVMLEQFRQEIAKLPQEYRGMEPGQLAQQLEAMDTRYLDKQRMLEEWEKEKDEIQAQLQKLTDILKLEELQENKLAAELGVNRVNLKQFADSLNARTAELADKEKAYLSFLASLGITAASDEQKRLAENDKKAELLQKKVEQNQIESEKKRTTLEQFREAIQARKDTLVKLQMEMKNLNAQKDEKTEKMQQLSGSSGISEQLIQTERKLEEYDRLEKQHRESISGLEKQLNTLLSQKSTLENQHRIYAENSEKGEKTLSAELSEKGFQSKQEAALAFIPDDKQQELKKEIEDYDQKALNIKAEKELVTKKLKSGTITEEEWNALENQYRETAAWKEACVAKSEIAKTGFEQAKSRHDRWLELHSRYTVLSDKFDLYQQIQRLLKAERSKDNSFIDYIAEERLRYVAAKASQLLGLMTKYKYELELDTNAGFIIRDNANGGVHRMVTSLSGGETFLTALSLALALSEQIQLKGQSPLEFFFLDEGFGTLDNNLLDTVLDALERLSRKERVIGIISHVPELRYRIARRLIITPPDANGEGSLACIEKA